MLLLPKKIGSFTLHRKLGTGGVAESYIGTHDTNAGRTVVVRRVLPYVQRDAARLASIEGRVKDLLGVRHPFLVHVVESFAEGDEHYIVEEHIDGVNLDKVLSWCRQHQRQIPHNVFLNIATQVCNGLEALHGRAGKGTSAEHVLHLALKPGAIFVTRDGKVMVGSYGLTRSPTTLPHGGVAGPVPTRMEYLSPEQTHPDQKLTPSSDIFALGAVLYELLTLDSLFRADSNLQTIHRVRRAEVTSQLLRVKELMPGLDKVLYRALSLNPRHRYQRAFVLREDLRGLMAGYSFATIAEDTRSFLAPLLENIAPTLGSVDAAPDAPANADSFNETPITHVDLDPMTTASVAAQNLAEKVARHKGQLDPVGPEDAGEYTENTSPRGVEDPPTEVHAESPRAAHEELDRPTLPGKGLDEPLDSTLAVESPRRAPPDPTVSSPDIGRIPPPAPVQLAAARPIPPASLPPLPHAGLTPLPESTAAFIAREAPASPNDTAAFIAREAPPLPAPGPPPELPPPVAAPPGPALSRPMPGPTLSRAMPPPIVPPKPVAAAPAPAPAPATPTLTPMAMPSPLPPPPAVEAAPPRPAAPPPAAAPAPRAPARPEPDAFDEPEPPPSGRTWIVVGGAAAALVAVLGCAGVLWLGFNSMQGGGTPEVAATPAAAPAAAPEAAPPAPAPGSDAAAVMADAAPPRLEPIEDAGAPAVADAAEAAPAPVAAPVAAPPPAPAPVASAPAASPPRTASTAAPAAAPAPSSSRTSAASTASASPSSRSSSPSASSSSSSRTAVSSAAPERAAPAPVPAPSSRSSASTSAAATPRAETSRPSSTASRSAPPAATAFEAPVDVSVEEAPVSDLDQYVDAAKKGKLASTDTTVLEMVDIADPSYSRARALLLMNAQRKGDDKATRKYLDQIMLLPENQYNPVYLTDYARWHVNHAEYDKALEKASLAERYWARIPPELVFSKKAEIYEIQAASYQGKFYKSDEDLELLGSAIKGWEKYRLHVSTKSRTDLQKRADTELARLQDIREKIQ